MNDLEILRQANIRRNKEHLDQLGILYKSPLSGRITKTSAKKPAKKRALNHAPSRVSARIASAPTRPAYDDDDNEENADASNSRRMKRTAKRGIDDPIKNETTIAPRLPPKSSEEMKAGWTSWQRTGSSPTRDDDLTFYFIDQPTFTPNKSPEEMLREGCFGGSYFRPLHSRHLGIVVENDYLELPPPWIEGLNVQRFLTSATYDSEVNKYKVKCGQSIEEWEAAGWINHRHDVRGWFQWYCRFFMGRRCEDDERQVGRWRKCAGETGRWRRALLKRYKAMGVREVFDDGEDESQGDVSPVMHQTCFQWAYECDLSSSLNDAQQLMSCRVRQGDLERYWASG